MASLLPNTRICTECGSVFNAERSDARTCTVVCRKRRSRRHKAGDKREYAVDVTLQLDAMQKATDHGLEHLPDIARQVVADELAPLVREALTSEVLESINDMMGLLPLAQAALAKELQATTLKLDEHGDPIFDANGAFAVEENWDAQHRAAALVMKYTVGQPGLAPQPEQPAMQPWTVNFTGLAAPPSIEATADEIDADMLPELESGASRQCDACSEVKPVDEFVGASPRCQACHDGSRARAAAAVVELTK